MNTHLQEARCLMGRAAVLSSPIDIKEGPTVSPPDVVVVSTLVDVLHYADSLGLDPIALSRMAEMHYIDERGEA